MLLERGNSPEDVAHAYIYLGASEYGLANFRESERYYKKALKLLQDVQTGRLLALAHWGLGTVAFTVERYPEAYEHLQVALNTTGSLLSPREHGALRSDLAIACCGYGRLDEALGWAKEALLILQQDGQSQWVADVCNTIGSIHSRCGDRQAARASYQRALLSLGGATLVQAVEYHYELARLEMEEGRFVEAFSHAQAALEIALRVKSVINEGRASLALSQVLIGLGRADQALPHLHRALAIFVKHGLEQSKVVVADVLQYVEGRQRGCAAGHTC